MDKTWKKVERAVAKIFGGKRVPVSGRGRGNVPDIDHPIFAFEVKCRPNHPALLRVAMDQAERSAEVEHDESGESKLPLVILHEWGQRHMSDLAVMRVKDFLRILAQIDQVKLWGLK